MTNQIEFTRVNNDVNGNPRYVVSYSHLLNAKDETEARERAKIGNKFFVDYEYQTAINKARKIGGKKFHNKQYGGGIVFQSYNLTDLEKSILELQNS